MDGCASTARIYKIGRLYPPPRRTVMARTAEEFWMRIGNEEEFVSGATKPFHDK
jgi:hypothetical protein